MERQSARLHALLRNGTFIHMPSVYDAIGGRLVQSLGYEAAYIAVEEKTVEARRK